MRERLGEIRDIERILTKVTLGKASSHDLIAFANSFEAFLGLKTVVDTSELTKNLYHQISQKA